MTDTKQPRTEGGARTLVGASAVSAGVVALVASTVGLARRTGAIPETPEQRRRETAHRRHDERLREAKGKAPSRTARMTMSPRNAPPPDDPSKPEGPEDMHKPSLMYSLKRTLSEFGSDQCTDIAAALVYYAVLALGPAIVAIVSILGLLSPSTISSLSNQILKPALAGSPSTYTLIDGLLTNASKAPGAGIGLVVGIVGAIWSASGYVGAFGRAMNRIYGIPEGRPVWKLRPTQLAVTLAVLVLVVLGALILVSTGPVVEHIAGRIGIGGPAFLVFSIVKWPVLVLIAVACVAILYYFSPNIRQPKFKWTSMGSVIALLVWALATVAFGLYLSFSGGGSYAKSYGPIAGVVIFLLWLWITNLALLFGAEFDAEIERGRELQAGMPAAQQIQLPMRDERGADKKAAKQKKLVDQARRLQKTDGRED
ncbi:YihY/virulence factor BrkB family protein [Amnibacterium sp. CER49]|uniref:YihY/virulence factor BrkB family protein n=1 Tax=Amnibacterium sp. CER49 TaxID=3039161 RepID=UPI0032643545